MASIRGSFGSDHTPFVPIAISSTPGLSTSVDAVVDTGFTGFVQLPAALAQRLSLMPRTAAEVEYPDGRLAHVPLAWGTVTLQGATQEGFMHIQQGTDEVIVGVEFLRLFRKILILSVADGTVLLIDSYADLVPA